MSTLVTYQDVNYFVLLGGGYECSDRQYLTFLDARSNYFDQEKELYFFKTKKKEEAIEIATEVLEFKSKYFGFQNKVSVTFMAIEGCTACDYSDFNLINYCPLCGTLLPQRMMYAMTLQPGDI